MGGGAEKKHLEDLGGNGSIIIKWILKEWSGGGVDWFDLA